MEHIRSKQMHVVCLLDGKPGHEKQTLGILNALEKKVPTKVTKIKIAPWSLWGSFLGVIRLYLPFSSSRKSVKMDPDLLLCTGSRTHLQTLLYKKQYKIPAITCMAPDLIYRSKFDICFVPVHDGFEQKDNIVTTIGPPNCSTNRSRHKARNGLIMVGGIDQKSHTWNSDDILGKITEIIRREPETSWLISSSPRTPDNTILMLEKMILLHPQASFYNYKDTSPGWVEKQYDNSAVVWVTADSVSMMFEALTAGCKVGVIPVGWKKKVNKFEKSVSFLVANRFILPFDAWLRSEDNWSDNVNLNEAQKCADIIIKRWWKKNL